MKATRFYSLALAWWFAVSGGLVAGCNALLGLEWVHPAPGVADASVDAAQGPDAGSPLADGSACPSACVGDVPVCDPVTHSCVGCVNATDCADASIQQCDQTTNRCWQCNLNQDCVSLAPFNKCDPATHQCAECLSSSDCTGGATCALGPDGRGACYVQCTTSADCTDAGPSDASAFTCCNQLCVQTSSNAYYCGSCETNCTNLGATVCCHSECVNSSTDQGNCGGCGQQCSKSETFNTCVAGQCTCPAGFILSRGLCQQTMLIEQSGLINLTNDCSDGGNRYMVYNQNYAPYDPRNLFGFQWLDDAGAYGFDASTVQAEFFQGWNCFSSSPNGAGSSSFWVQINNGICYLFGTPTSSSTCQCSPSSTYVNAVMNVASCVYYSGLPNFGYNLNGTPNQVLLQLTQAGYTGYPLLPDASIPALGLSVNTAPALDLGSWLGSYGRITVTY